MAHLRYLLLFFIAALPLTAQTTWSITPDSGPTSGGQEVIVKGQFGLWPYGLIFGTASVPATRVDDTTLRAITPPHPSGTVDVVVFEYDMGISTGLTYTYVDDEEGAFERVLLPIFLQPIFGAHGSEFVTDFQAYNRSELPILMYGLQHECDALPCYGPPDGGLYFAPRWGLAGSDVQYGGNPGAFVYVPRSQANDLAMQLRVYDVSREATNFGTEIPVVREDDLIFADITLLGVPTDARFRNTLRIYGTWGWNVIVRIEGAGGYLAEHVVTLSESQTPYDPAYGVFTAFPNDIGPVRVTIDIEPPDCCIIDPLPPLPSPPAIWGFITVTNNDTQHITVISPQR